MSYNKGSTFFERVRFKTSCYMWYEWFLYSLDSGAPQYVRGEEIGLKGRGAVDIIYKVDRGYRP